MSATARGGVIPANAVGEEKEEKEATARLSGFRDFCCAGGGVLVGRERRRCLSEKNCKCRPQTKKTKFLVPQKK